MLTATDIMSGDLIVLNYPLWSLTDDYQVPAKTPVLVINTRLANVPNHLDVQVLADNVKPADVHIDIRNIQDLERYTVWARLDVRNVIDHVHNFSITPVQSE